MTQDPATSSPPVRHRDGTSQSERRQAALDPTYVSVDERTIKDLLAFAQRYSTELRYYGADNLSSGDWSGFVVPAARRPHQADPIQDGKDIELFLDELVAFIATPEQFVNQGNLSYARPHLVLFLTFLSLRQQARTRLNDLTRRHLEFYYREALALTAKPAIPDRVHVLVDLAAGEAEFLLPAGTLLVAGQDSQGTDLLYKTEENLLANQAQVAAFKSLFVNRQVIGIGDVRQDYKLLTNLPIYQTLDDIAKKGGDTSFIAMLSMALGDPGPGGLLPLYPPGQSSQKPLTPDLLVAMDQLLAFIQDTLHLTLPAFRTLMELKQQETGPERGLDWGKVNSILETAGKKRTPGVSLDHSSTDFESNLKAALGVNDWTVFFATLPEVNNVYDLYRKSTEQESQTFITTNMYMSVDDFTSMMSIVDDVYKNWRHIYDILRAAGKKVNPPPAKTADQPNLRAGAYDVNKFNLLVNQTLGTPKFPQVGDKTLGGLDDCYAEVQNLEKYFCMSAEDFVSIRSIEAKASLAKSWEWEQVDDILERAYEASRLPRCLVASGFEAMLKLALGDPKPGDNLPGGKDFTQLDPVKDASYIQDQLYLEISNFSYIKEIYLNSNAGNPKPTDTEWAQVYQILELAQARKPNWQEPRAQIEIWRNMYVAADATALQVPSGAPEDAATPHWRTFGDFVGDAQAPVGASGGDAQPRAAIGLAIASPILALAEGVREITVQLNFNETTFVRDAIDKALAITPFRFFLSTRDKMVEVTPAGPIQPVESAATKQQAAVHALQVKLQLPQQLPPVEPLTATPGSVTPITTWPILQIILADVPQNNDQIQRAFQSLLLENVTLTVSVTGITQLTLQNDGSVLAAKTPFEPFGISPNVGSSFFIAHQELCSKKLDSVSLDIDWMGVPDNLNQYYQGYEKAYPGVALQKPLADNTIFQAALSLYDNRRFLPINGNIQLFNADPPDKKTGAGKTSHVARLQSDIITPQDSTYQAELELVTSDEVLSWSRYWKLELLAPDFQHSVYPRAAALNAQVKPEPVIINPPYTPKIKSLSMGYSASVTIDPAQSQAASGNTLYHLEPFGYREIKIVTDQAGKPGFSPPEFLPQYDQEGELYIGMTDLTPPRNLALLIQVAEGSADPDVALEPVHWDFLTDNAWQTLEDGHVLSDTTNGWRNSGIITLDVPSVLPSTRLPAGFYWIRASIARNSRSVCDTVAILAQAVSATWVDQGNAPDHLDQPLPPRSITGLADPLPEVKAIQQPYSSIDGKGPEEAGRFSIRVSERLRHKNRALTSWDYERLVLEAFPAIHKVKCLPVGTADDPRLADSIRLIVIPDIRGKVPFDPFEPKVPADTLEQINQFLLRRCSPQASLTVTNPAYVPIWIRLSVRFRPGYNVGYSTQALIQELNQYLAPWAYDRSADVVFGGQIKANLIVNFVEERPYVDYVAGIKLFNDNYPTDSSEVPNEYTIDPDSILVSARQPHQIDLITQEGYEPAVFSGIGYMIIGRDFIVS